MVGLEPATFVFEDRRHIHLGHSGERIQSVEFARTPQPDPNMLTNMRPQERQDFNSSFYTPPYLAARPICG